MKFLLVRGESGLMYLYEREVWDAIRGKEAFTVIADSDDRRELMNLQKLVNDDLKKEVER